MKKELYIALLAVLALFSVACSPDESETHDIEPAIEEAVIQWLSHDVDTHIYLPERMVANISPGGVLQGSMIHADSIYYYYADTRSFSGFDIVVVSHNIMTGEITRLTLPFNNYVEIAGMDIAEDGNITVFAVSHIHIEDEDEDDFSIMAFYAKYDTEGNQLYKRDFDELFDYEAGSMRVQQAVFVNDAYIVVSVTYAEFRGFHSTVHIIDLETGDVSVLHSEEFLLRGMMSILYDGRIVVLDRSALNQTSVREVNIDDGAWGDVIATIDIDAIMFVSAVTVSPCELLISTEDFLYRYNLEQGELTALLDWSESEIHRVWGLRAGFFKDGRMYVISVSWNDDDEPEYELYILTPEERADSEERIVLTLGGLNIGPDMTQAVSRFNRSSITHEIVIEEYNPSGDLAEGFERGLLRLQTELIAGRGPDIIYNAREEAAARGLLLDLHPFLLEDRELDSEDFVPSFLSALESPDGALYMIANEFAVETMVGTSDNLGHIQSWTTEAFLELLETADNMEYPWGYRVTNFFFVWFLINGAHRDFVCFGTYEANFDNEAFINILEMAKHFHDSLDQETFDSLPHDYLRMLRGDQLLTTVFVQDIMDYLFLSITVPDNIAIGFPTESGGVHTVSPISTPLGINATTEHPDAAWEFLRQFLLPTENEFWRLSLRMDMLDEAIEYLMSPQYGFDAEGDRARIPRAHMHFPCGTAVTLYYLAEEAAETLRFILLTAQPGENMMLSLWISVIEDSISPFFAGAMTAEDAARIVQNRAQIYLSEQNLF